MTANEKIALIKEMLEDFYEGRHEGEDAYAAMLGAVFTVVAFGDGERSENEYGEGNDNVKLVKSALEKQIPIKPKKIGEDYINGRWECEYECSVCGNPYADDSYCSCCGQALDWGDTE